MNIEKIIEMMCEKFPQLSRNQGYTFFIDFSNGNTINIRKNPNTMWHSNKSDMKIIAAIKRGLHRLYGDQQQGYRVNYSGVLRSPTDAILVTSQPKIGTASTTRLKLTYQITNDMNIEQIARIFNDLRYLDWNSLFSQPKTILPLHIVQNLAKLSKEDVIVPYVPR